MGRGPGHTCLRLRWEAQGRHPSRDGDRLATAGLRGLLGITDVSCGDSEDGVSPTVPASGVTFSGDPDWSVEHLERWCGPRGQTAPFDMAQKNMDPRMALEALALS